MIITILFVLLLACGVYGKQCASPSMGLKFFNWDGEKSCKPATFHEPENEEDVISLLKETAPYPVKVVGGGLSFSGIQLEDNAHMLSLERMNKILDVNMNPDGSALVTVQAGIRIRDLIYELDDRGLAMINLGATANQTIAGACATGTHGTGRELGGLATSIRELRLINANGQVENLRSGDAVFQASATGLGRLGIITSVTLHVVPQFKMKMYQYNMELSRLLVELPSLMEQHPRLQWSWLPYHANATVVIREEVPWSTPIEPSGPDGGCWSNTQNRNPCVDLSFKTLTDNAEHFKARTRYTEMEMMIPIEKSIEAVRDYESWMETVKDQYDPSITISVMLRYVAGDKISMSPFYERDTAVLSFIVVGDAYSGGDQAVFERYSKGLQDLCEEKYEGRPHWGKVNWVNEDTPQQLASVYPQFDTFLKLAQRLDPEGRFNSVYLKERFGQ